MNSPIKYFGGKNVLSKRIIEHFPQTGYSMYVEPFGGSFGVGLHLPEELIAPNEIYNDLDGNVYALFKTISDKDSFGWFKGMCELSLYDDDIRCEFKEQLKRDDISLLERAFYFFYVNRTSHNGIGGFSINTCVRRKMSKSVSDYLSTVDGLTELHNRLSHIVFCHKDGLEIMKRYDKEDTLFYCDPPYVHDTRKSNTRYNVEMTNEEHEKFVDICINSKAKIIISGYDHEIYHKLTDNGFTQIDLEVKTTTGTHKPKDKIETLWKNF